ncbi:IclR family transcriptional regulator [Nocardia vermiculata]|uniref:IclR family transcriptional regulator n=1 Tax=Nocardia vermiculata TaxID=257274 RepID=A0A846Y066_9NOCA|nr:IclR family transcriptional regulator [Nocardia vermiculata]NKY51482.1 IclR family transcriptional regulator [Nocardia vermiculata]
MTAELDDRSVLGRALRILYAFGIEDQAVGLSELTRRTGLPKATVHRICGDLVAARLLTTSAAGYRLGRGLFELGMRAAAERTLLELAMPFMQDLFTRTGETVHLAVLDGDEVVYVGKVGGHRQAPAPSRVGGRMPLYCTGIGKALLAYSDRGTIDRILSGPLIRRTPRTLVVPGLLHTQLQNVREQGVAYEYEESAIGVVCVAAPILGTDDRPLAALSITGPATRFQPDKHAPSARAAAAGVASILARRAQLSA